MVSFAFQMTAALSEGWLGQTPQGRRVPMALPLEVLPV